MNEFFNNMDTTVDPLCVCMIFPHPAHGHGTTLHSLGSIIHYHTCFHRSPSFHVLHTQTPENGLIRAPIAVCVLGAPLTGKSHFCRALSARRNLVLLSPEAVLKEAQEYADAEALRLEEAKAQAKLAAKNAKKKGGDKSAQD